MIEAFLRKKQDFERRIKSVRDKSVCKYLLFQKVTFRVYQVRKKQFVLIVYTSTAKINL